MERADKVKVVEDLKDKFSKARATFITDYRGISANEMAKFRRELKNSSNELKIVRNTLARRALDGTDIEGISEHFFGTTAVVFSYEDAVGAAKTLTDYTKKLPTLKLKTGTLGDKVLSVDEIRALSEMPSREELLAKMVGPMNAPLSGLVGVLSGVPRNLVYALNAIARQKEA